MANTAAQTYVGATGVTGPAGTSASTDGWNSISATLTYSSADSPTFVATTSSDLTGSIGVGSRIKLTQTTVKYFIVTAITSSTITLYGGTDYTLANAAITSPYSSLIKTPIGFITDPLKWTVEFTDTAQRSQTSPVANTWYNQSTSITIPIGAWRAYYTAHIQCSNGNVSDTTYSLTLSTGNNNESQSSLTTAFRSPSIYAGCSLHTEIFLNLASKTIYYLNMKQDNNAGGIYIRGDYAKTVIRAECAYL